MVACNDPWNEKVDILSMVNWSPRHLWTYGICLSLRLFWLTTPLWLLLCVPDTRWRKIKETKRHHTILDTIQWITMLNSVFSFLSGTHSKSQSMVAKLWNTVYHVRCIKVVWPCCWIIKLLSASCNIFCLEYSQLLTYTRHPRDMV